MNKSNDKDDEDNLEEKKFIVKEYNNCLLYYIDSICPPTSFCLSCDYIINELTYKYFEKHDKNGNDCNCCFPCKSIIKSIFGPSKNVLTNDIYNEKLKEREIITIDFNKDESIDHLYNLVDHGDILFFGQESPSNMWGYLIENASKSNISHCGIVLKLDEMNHYGKNSPKYFCHAYIGTDGSNGFSLSDFKVAMKMFNRKNSRMFLLKMNSKTREIFTNKINSKNLASYLNTRMYFYYKKSKNEKIQTRRYDALNVGRLICLVYCCCICPGTIQSLLYQKNNDFYVECSELVTMILIKGGIFKKNKINPSLVSPEQLTWIKDIYEDVYYQIKSIDLMRDDQFIKNYRRYNLKDFLKKVKKFTITPGEDEEF